MELDIVMNADTPLWKAHDVGERLQDKIEALPGVERAFVHVDHETSHAPVRVTSVLNPLASPVPPPFDDTVEAPHRSYQIRHPVIKKWRC